MAACDYVGLVSANKEDNKMEKAGFTTTKSEFVNAPVINELPLTLECELTDVIGGSKIFGKIVNVSIDEKVLGEDGELSLEKFSPIITIQCITDITGWERESEMPLKTEMH